MTNRQKAKGDAYERDVLRMARTAGFPYAERTRPGRREDEGDIHLAPGVILQTKDVASPQWREWLAQTEQQRRCAQADHGVLVVKRRGTGGRPPLHLAVMDLDSMLRLLCEAGWGDPDARLAVPEAEDPGFDGSWCWVCRRTLSDAESDDRDRRGCGPHCDADAELADRYEREGDHR